MAGASFPAVCAEKPVCACAEFGVAVAHSPIKRSVVFVIRNSFAR
jgi:hypothetical protein